MIPRKDLEQTSTTYLVQLLTEHDQWFAQGQHWATSTKAQEEAEQIRVELAKRAEARAMKVWNVRMTVVDLVYADTADQAIEKLRRRLARADVEEYTGDPLYAADAFESEVSK